MILRESHYRDLLKRLADVLRHHGVPADLFDQPSSMERVIGSHVIKTLEFYGVYPESEARLTPPKPIDFHLTEETFFRIVLESFSELQQKPFNEGLNSLRQDIRNILVQGGIPVPNEWMRHVDWIKLRNDLGYLI